MEKFSTTIALGLLIISISACSNPDESLKIVDANVVLKDEMPQLKICFNRPLEAYKTYISDIKVKTKDGFTFGRSDMYVGNYDGKTKELCVFEVPYTLLRNTRDTQIRENFNQSYKPNNIANISIKLGTQQVQLSYSEDYKLTEFNKSF